MIITSEYELETTITRTNNLRRLLESGEITRYQETLLTLLNIAISAYWNL